MTAQKSKLEKAQSISTILSAIAIPVVLGLTGYSVQQSIAEDGIKKDYLTMAVGMLRDGDKNLDPELKAWATAVVSKYSPVPFSPTAEEKLGHALYISPSIPPLADAARQSDPGALCKSGCSVAMKEKYESWRLDLSQAKGSGAKDVLVDILDQSVKRNLELAAALDLSMISGRTCERIYDSLQDTPK